MVIFHSYVKLPEGRDPQKTSGWSGSNFSYANSWLIFGLFNELGPVWSNWRWLVVLISPYWAMFFCFLGHFFVWKITIFLMGKTTIMGHFMVMINEKLRNYCLVLWNIWIIFPFSWECHHPNWRSPSFFRGVGIPPSSFLCLVPNKNHTTSEPNVIISDWFCAHQQPIV